VSTDLAIASDTHGKVENLATVLVGGQVREKPNTLGLGFTLGYTINKNLGLTVGHKPTVNERTPEDLRRDCRRQ
jgi:hypothetical protein